MRVGVCQLHSTVGDFDGNLAKVVSGLERAQRDRLDILCFPECYLTGYSDTAEAARAGAFALDSPQMMKILDKSTRFDSTFVDGFNEVRDGDLYNTAAVVHKGHVLGTYSKCTAYMPFHKQGRTFPVFERAGVRFGVVICSDGGYIEPARILATKGAKLILAPHYNYIGAAGLLGHFTTVRADHTARAVENGIHFVRANSVTVGKETGITRSEGVGYGDSYIIDPHGEVLVRSRRHVEDYFFADLDLTYADKNWGVGRSLFSHREFGKYLSEAASEALKK
ncbi:carbon-nitrogen hydrolase family protein [Fimbriiglobus ruber]|uniref:Nitrilase/cyanide hydratase and apolipoprotein N-acyltransferase n=1 Tax=Fimbriiglobus ruber TaxID=1908690 RepID=A0A225EA18_9BACT|nr:carbon-nitrogen hydrolase family protein [Fimbriiglobus ruber]OWK46876.1 Nitrilase/cyanide hydratase and apolipoprotein N-acyltransferase [Fimbriiglobus ruber]